MSAEEAPGLGTMYVWNPPPNVAELEMTPLTILRVGADLLIRSDRPERLDRSGWEHRDDHGHNPIDRKPEFVRRGRKPKEREPIA